jgi:pyrimidine-nucleoside phosphorylase
MFYPPEIIALKRDGLELSQKQIEDFVRGITDGTIADYQSSALLMAIYINGFNRRETAALTRAMMYSGKTMEFNDPTVIDKHSTGGVGDKTSFIIAPLAAACGVKVPMVAGRGLGHTGGTVDKIEAIKNFNTSLSLEEFQQHLKEKSLVLMGQTNELAPADKKLYSLRDVTATISSIPLITASIMSKKLAEGAAGIVMDIKWGNGAFMETKAQAKKLAKSIVQTGLSFNRHMMVTISDMNQPLGHAIGNSLELIECFETLKGKGPKDLEELSLNLAGGMIHLAGKSKSLNGGIKKAREALKNGNGLKHMKDLIAEQGGDPAVMDDYSRLPLAEKKKEIKASREGFLTHIECKNFGLHCVNLGGGRHRTSDKIDFGVGLIQHKKKGEKIEKGEVLTTLYYNKGQEQLVQEIEKEILERDLVIKSKNKKNYPSLIEDTQISFSTGD